MQLKNYPKTLEYADKVIALGDKVTVDILLRAIQTRCQVFPYTFNPKAADAHDQLVKERDAALQGAKLLASFSKPANSTLTDEQFAAQIKAAIAFFYSSEGFADLQLKDYAASITAFKSTVENNPNDAVRFYRLGLSYLQSSPPQYLDGFWALARSINLNIPGKAQVKDYLKKQILVYEQPGCDSGADAQLSELLQLAGTTGERPATYTITSQADLDKIRQASNILSVIADLSGGGDKAKMTWLAICSAQFPEVVGKIIDIQPGDGFVDFMAYTGATQDDMEKATTANMDVKVWTTGTPPAPVTIAGATQTGADTAQPEVVRLQKDDGIRFSGTLVSYDPNPFLLHWDQVKVDPTIIPEKAETGKHHRVPPKKGAGK
ncbi:MAG: hypothetical protein ACREQC_14340 [Candidatus Binataceae bacterium]